MVRCMMKTKNLPKLFWIEAVTCAIYVLNSYLTKSINDKTHKKYGLVKIPKLDTLECSDALHIRIYILTSCTTKKVEE